MYRNLAGKMIVVVTGTLLLALGACSGKRAVKPAAVAGEASSTAAGTSGAVGGSNLPNANAGTVGGAAGNGASAPVGVARLIYFDFDSSEIRPEFISVVAAHARALAANASIRIRLEGHTDERGSREYNIGLGERRAQSVRRALLLQGVSEAQVATVSYGAERPAVAGQDEVAWAKNRRVEFVYLN